MRNQTGAFMTRCNPISTRAIPHRTARIFPRTGHIRIPIITAIVASNGVLDAEVMTITPVPTRPAVPSIRAFPLCQSHRKRQQMVPANVPAGIGPKNVP